MQAGDLVAFRGRAGLSQEALADLLGVHRITVWRWENGHTDIPLLVARAVEAMERDET
jgi:DNA-binding XRE family transcriptional regulator